ncbi:MAG: hypothetical protein KDG89_07810 [Geminicoccaceae bacterium]|nr:hypothetical protein [Geminicoccaceae bacterium]
MKIHAAASNAYAARAAVGDGAGGFNLAGQDAHRERAAAERAARARVVVAEADPSPPPVPRERGIRLDLKV